MPGKEAWFKPTHPLETAVERTDVRYIVEYSNVWNCWYVLDEYTFEEVCTSDKKEDIDVICECLNLIKYER